MLLHDLLFRLRALTRHPAAENELDDELRFHLERQIDKYVKSGMSQAEACVAHGWSLADLIRSRMSAARLAASA